MEGTRHEKVILITSSYVIGFVTAFIAFGVNTAKEQPVVVVNTPQTAAVVHAVEKKAPVAVIEQFGEDQEGLSVAVDGERMLLSAKRSSVDDELLGEKEVEGLHYKIIDAVLSQDKKYLYFCEQLGESSDNCNSYIFDAESGELHRVSLAGEHYKSPLSDNEISWSNNGYLYVNGMISFNVKKPWELNGNDEVISQIE